MRYQNIIFQRVTYLLGTNILQYSELLGNINLQTVFNLGIN